METNAGFKQSQSGRQITESGRSPEDVKKVEIIAIGRTRIITPLVSPGTVGLMAKM